MLQRRFRQAVSVLVLLLLVAGCSGDGPTGPDDDDDILTGAGMSARVGGTPWTATVAFANRTTAAGQIMAVSGSSTTTTIAFAFVVASNTDTYTIGQNGTNAVVSTGMSNWSAPAGGTVQNPDGTGGQIRITSMTDERVKGTFSFVVGQAGGGAGETLEITNGQFDVAFTSGLGAR